MDQQAVEPARPEPALHDRAHVTLAVDELLHSLVRQPEQLARIPHAQPHVPCQASYGLPSHRLGALLLGVRTFSRRMLASDERTNATGQ